MSNQHKVWTEELEREEKFNDFAKYEHALHIHNEKYLNMQRINSQIIHRGKDLIQVSLSLSLYVSHIMYMYIISPCCAEGSTQYCTGYKMLYPCFLFRLCLFMSGLQTFQVRFDRSDSQPNGLPGVIIILTELCYLAVVVMVIGGW